MRPYARFDACGGGRSKQKEGGVNVGVKDTYPSAVCRVAVHGDIEPTILASIPLYLTMVETCIPKKNIDVTRKQRVEEGESKRMEDGGRGFALILMPGKVKSLFGTGRKFSPCR